MTDRDDSPVLIDRRTGSKELAPLFERYGVTAEITTLEFADAMIFGNGPSGTVPVGIERKTITDLCQSLLSDRLVGHQLPGLVQMYPYAWLVIEGPYRVTYDDVIEIPRRDTWVKVPSLLGGQLNGWLLTLQLKSHIRVWRTRSDQETVQFIAALHQWWTGKAWADHRGHLSLYQMGIDASLFTQPSLVRRVAAELPGVGFQKSAAVEQHFPSVLAMAAAPSQEWIKIPGIGKTLAARLPHALQGEM